MTDIMLSVHASERDREGEYELVDITLTYLQPATECEECKGITYFPILNGNPVQMHYYFCSKNPVNHS